MTGKVVDGRHIGTTGEGIITDLEVYIYYAESGDKWLRFIDGWNNQVSVPVRASRDLIDLITKAINTEGNHMICPVCGRDLKETIFEDSICSVHGKIDVPAWEKKIPRYRDD